MVVMKFSKEMQHRSLSSLRSASGGEARREKESEAISVELIMQPLFSADATGKEKENGTEIFYICNESHLK